MLLDNTEPTSYGEAMVGPYSDKWLEAMKSEINGSLRRRRTWTVMLPSMKLDLWQRVFPQVQGVDYDEIFSSVAMLKSVGIMLALAAFMKSGRWMSKQVSLPVFVRKGCMWYNQKGFVDPKDAKRYASSSDPSLDWSKHLGVGIYTLIRWSKILGLYKVYEKLVFPKKWVGAL